MKITEYKIVASPMGIKLEELVEKWIKLGWQPFGNLVYDGSEFRQAMVKYGS